jgi:hypothetical protein
MDCLKMANGLSGIKILKQGKMLKVKEQPADGCGAAAH